MIQSLVPHSSLPSEESLHFFIHYLAGDLSNRCVWGGIHNLLPRMKKPWPVDSEERLNSLGCWGQVSLTERGDIFKAIAHL